MDKEARLNPRRDASLSRERIIEAAIELLDHGGEEGLTYRALSERLATGPGALYWHIASKSDLLVAACDVIVARTLSLPSECATPQDTVRAVALGLFDAMDAHPWIGSVLMKATVSSPLVQVVERLGQQVCALGVPEEGRWAVASALGSYILGVGGQNAANGRFARDQGIDRAGFLEAVAQTWSQLDPKQYPFTRSVANQLRVHDDRVDFLAGIDLLLAGINATQRH